MNFKELMLGVLSGAAEEVEETGIEAGLEALYAKNPAEWKVTCDALTIAVDKLKAIPTSSKFLSALVEGLGIAVKQSLDLHTA